MGKHFHDVDDVNDEVNEVVEEVEEEETESEAINAVKETKAKIDALARVCKSETCRLDNRIDQTNQALEELNGYVHGSFQGASELNQKIEGLNTRLEAAEKKVKNQVNPEKIADCLGGQKELMKIVTEMRGKIEELDEEIKHLSDQPAPTPPVNLNGIAAQIDVLEKKFDELSGMISRIETLEKKFDEMSGIISRIETLEKKFDELATRPVAPSNAVIQRMVNDAVSAYLSTQPVPQPVPVPQPQPAPQPVPVPQPQPQPTLYQRANPVEPDPVDIKSFFEFENENFVIRQEEEQLTLELANTIESGKKSQHEKATERKSFWVDAAGKPVRELTAKELENLGLIKKK